MKKYIALVFSLVLFISCSSNKCIETYFKEEIKIKKEEAKTEKEDYRKPVLFSRKGNLKFLVTIYKRHDFFTKNKLSKTYNDEVYNFLKTKSETDTITEYWTEKKSKVFGMDSIIFKSDYHIGKVDRCTYYSISKPVYLKDKKMVLFQVSSFIDNEGSSNEDAVIIMRKEKGKWIKVEKVISQESL
jgi:hypothetical protein